MTTTPTTIPSESDFLAAFGIEPTEAEPADGYWSYTFKDEEDGDELRFSFNAHERSVQTVWVLRGRTICTVVHENAAAVRIVESPGTSAILVEFVHGTDECKTSLELQVLPDLEVRWSSILT